MFGFSLDWIAKFQSYLFHRVADNSRSAADTTALTTGQRRRRVYRMSVRSTRLCQHFPLSATVFVAIFLLLISPQAARAQEQKGKAAARSSSKISTADAELARLRAEVIEKMKVTRASTEKLLVLHEDEVKKLTEVYQQRRELYNQGLISRAELNLAERALAMAMVRVSEDKRWIMESDIALTEASMRDVLLGLPSLSPGGYSESGTLIRFNGASSWSLNDVAKIEKFFSQTFGHTLPISAFGQTATHDRLRFDHKNAIDVALHPDSNEGRSLLLYLRQAGIPFIAFRGAVAGAATGAHIHIGKPSIRTAAVAGVSGPECCK
jgi:hypothetical protein